MNWLRKAIIRWLHNSNSRAPGGLLKGSEGGGELLSMLASTEQAHNINIVPIGNGFLLCRRVYNTQGPDKITATYAKGAEELGPMLIAELATARITK
jgi:hypothetical protein